MFGRMLLYVFALFGLVAGQATITIDGLVNRTITTSGVMYGSVEPLVLMVVGTDAVVRCGSTLRAQFYGMVTTAVFTIGPPPFSFLFVDVSGVSTTLLFQWCGPGQAYATHDVMAVQAGVVPETHGRIVAGACPPSMLNDGDFSGVAMLVAGDRHACGMLYDGRVYCWGTNDLCQFGVGVPTAKPTTYAVLYPHFDDFIWLTANGGVTCGIRRVGDVVCWGMLRGVPAPNQPCETNGYARFGFGLGVTSSQSMSIGITRNGIAVTNNNHIYMVELSGVFGLPRSDWSLYSDYSITSQRGGVYWSQYPIWTVNLFTFKIYRGIVSHGDTAFGILDLQYGFIGWFGAGAPCDGLIETSYAGAGCFLAVSLGVVPPITTFYFPGGTVLLYDQLVYATTIRIFAPINASAYGFFYSTFYGAMMGVGANYDANSGAMTDGLPRSGFDCRNGGVCVMCSGRCYAFTRGRGHYCMFANTWVCAGDNLNGQLQFWAGALNNTGTFVSVQVVAGGDVTCSIIPLANRVRCVGVYGTGVVAFVGADVYAGFVDGSVARGLPAQASASFTGSDVTRLGIAVGGIPVYVTGRGGCFVEYAVACGNATYNFSASSSPRRYAIQCGPGLPMCVELQSCVVSDWAVHGDPVSTGVVVSISAGDTYTCRLLLNGIVECVGEVMTCGYILPVGGAYDMLEFNAVYTGGIGPIGRIASTKTTTCYVAQDGHAVACSGSTPVYRWCTPQTMFVATATDGMIIEDVWVGSSAVCYSEAVVPLTMTTTLRRVWCAGVTTPTNVLGYSGTLVGNVMRPTPVGQFGVRLLQNSTYAPLLFWGRVQMMLDMDGTADVGPCMVVGDARCMPIVFGVPQLVINRTMFCAGLLTSAAMIRNSISARYNGTGFSTFGGIVYDGGVVAVGGSYGNISCVVLKDGYAACVGQWDQPGVREWDRMAGVWGARYGRLWKVGNGRVARVAAGMRHVVLLTVDNAMYCIGDNGYGQCGRMYTNISSDGVAVSMSPSLALWPYTEAVDAATLIPVVVPVTVYDISLSAFIMSPLMFCGVGFMALAGILSYVCAYNIHRRFVWTVKQR